MEILSFSTVDFLYGALSSDGDVFPFTERTFIEIFVRIESYCFHIFLTITTIESHLPSFLEEFLFSFFKSRDIDEIVIGSHRYSFKLLLTVIPNLFQNDNYLFFHIFLEDFIQKSVICNLYFLFPGYLVIEFPFLLARMRRNL